MTDADKARAEELIGLLHHPSFACHLESHYLTYKDVLLLMEYQWEQFISGEANYR